MAEGQGEANMLRQEISESQSAIVEAVIARLSGETWYHDTRESKNVLLGLPYYVVESNGVGYHVNAKGRRYAGHMRLVDGLESPGYVACARPVFPGSDGTTHYTRR